MLKKARLRIALIEVHTSDAIKRFAALAVPQIEYRPSLLWMAHRLLRVDSKPIDALVDMTNYAMLDMSQPMHAFDADCIPSKMLACVLRAMVSN